MPIMRSVPVVAPLHAVFAGAAGDQRVHRDAPSRARPLEDAAGEFVAEDQRRHAPRIVAVVRVHVRAADADRIHLDQHVAEAHLRLRLVAVGNLVRCGVDERFHPAENPPSTNSVCPVT
jgi:hypothetical protein